MLSRLSVLFLALTYLILPIHLTLPTTVLARSNLRNVPQLPVKFEIAPSEEEKAHYWAQGGNDIVHQIWSVLRDFEPTWKDSVAQTSPSGITQTAWHYLKVVFRTLFMNGPTRQEHDNDSIDDSSLRGDLRNAVETLQIGAAHDDPDAIFLLAEMNYYGNFSHPRNFKVAFRQYETLANLDGNATAQHMLGLMYATGVGGAVERDLAKSLMFHTFAAEQDEVKSEMTLAFRYHTGIGIGRDCNKAADYYRRVADKSMEWWLSGPPGGHSMQRNAVRWAEYEGGSYGEGASVSSAGPNALREDTIRAKFDDVLEYLDVKERQGDWNAALSIAKHFYEPPRGYKRDLRSARKKFMRIAAAYWDKDGKPNSKAARGLDKIAGKAAAYLGRMFLRGEDIKQNFGQAEKWLRRGVANGDPWAQYHLGLMYRDGLGLPKDGYKAGLYLKEAAEQGLGSAQSALGVLFLDQGDIDTAGRYFELASGAGIMEAFYYLAELTNEGIGRDRNCGLAVIYYKYVVEKAEMLHSSFAEANSAYDRGDLERAFIASLGAAEQGYESAQANIAWLLDQKNSVVNLPSIPLLSNPLSPIIATGSRRTKLLKDPSLALVYYTRSAKQANIDSLLKMGDYYMAGTLTSNASLSPSASSSPSSKISSQPDVEDKNTTGATQNELVGPSLDKASTCYTHAAEYHHSAQALWNLGWMHENGIGPIQQDFHMAKRYYDLALEMNKEAYLPVKLALIKLRIRSWWNGISGGSVNSIGDSGDDDDEEVKKGPKTFMEWLNRFLDAAVEMDARDYADLQQRDRADGVDEIDLTYGGEAGMPGGDAEYWYDNNANNAADDADPFGADYYGDFDDGILESLAIIALAGALALLVYARQNRQRANQEPAPQIVQQQPAPPQGLVPQQQPPNTTNANPQSANQEEQNDDQPNPNANANQAAGGGLFPQPGEPEFANWVAGGIGH